LAPIKFSYATSYRLSVITFALYRSMFSHTTHSILQTTATDCTRQTQHYSISATVSMVGQKASDLSSNKINTVIIK